MSERPAGGQIEDLGLSDIACMLTLNNANAAAASLLDEASMALLLRTAFYVRGIDRGATAFLIALDQNAAYVNPNFRWFRECRKSFVYIDRVLVAETSRGHGLGRKLYQDLFAAAGQAGHDRIVCEVNINPPNPASEAFHEVMGFMGIGDATIYEGKKTVRYFEKTLE